MNENVTNLQEDMIEMYPQKNKAKCEKKYLFLLNFSQSFTEKFVTLMSIWRCAACRPQLFI